MDEYLTEREQIELIKQWWRENRWFLLGGVAIAGLGWFGYQQYQAYRDSRAEQAADLYFELKQTLEDDADGADALLERLRTEHAGSPYAHQASLLMARKVLISDTARAVQELRFVMEASDDPGLASIARLRLARVLAYQERFSEALEVLNVEDPGPFAARLNEIKGDIYVATGDAEAARSAYTQALTAEGSESIDRGFVQMKLNQLLQAPTAPASTEGA